MAGSSKERARVLFAEKCLCAYVGGRRRKKEQEAEADNVFISEML